MHRSLLVLALCLGYCLAGTLKAGAAKVDGTLPVGVPLAGYNHGARRWKDWPLFQAKNYTNWMTPSTGVMDPTWVKALVLDDGTTQVAFVTIDAIGSDKSVNRLAYLYAYELGFRIPEENVIISGSHSHSGPGAISADFLWQFAPAMDMLVSSLQAQMARSIGQAMYQAYSNMTDAVIGITTGNLTGVTQNRRARISPYVTPTTIDPNLGLIRVDDVAGNPIATLWNFAIHGVCYGPDNLLASGDIMGKTCEYIEKAVGGVALFANADAGDIDPGPGACNNAPEFTGAGVIAKAVQVLRDTTNASATVTITAASQIVDFGPTDLNYTFARFSNCTQGGFLDVCTFCEILRCDLNEHMGESWLTNQPMFTAIRFDLLGKNAVVVTAPGEPLLELGWWIRNDTLDLGFDTTLLFGYSQAHMGYFAPPDEYDIGGYESQLTFWGIETADKIRQSCKAIAQQVAP